MSLSSILLRVATHEPDQTNNLSDKIFHIAQGVLNRAGFSHDRSDIWNRLLIFIAIIIVAYLAYFIFCKLLIKLVHKIIIHRSDKWEKFLFDRRFFNHIFGLVPPIIVLGLLPLAFSPEYAKLLRILEKLINIYIVIVIARIFISFIKCSYDYYLKRKKLTTSA